MRWFMSSAHRPAAISAAMVLPVGLILIASYELGPQAFKMGQHIALMNVAAPLLAKWAVQRTRTSASAASLWGAAIVQIVLLWVWHAPAVHDAAASFRALEWTLNGVLLLAALWFWTSLLNLSRAQRWHAIPALLLTGKLACLLAALLIFAPRALYEVAGHSMHAVNHSSLPALADQQLAGLLMITACPLSYLVAAIVIVVDLINAREAIPQRSPHLAR